VCFVEKAVRSAAAEKGLAFFALEPAGGIITWAGGTGRNLGEEIPDRVDLSSRLTAGIRAYLNSELACPGTQRLRGVFPVGGQVVEAVFLPWDGTGLRDGYCSPYPLHEPMETLKKYFLSNISNKLRSLLNSVIIAGDVVAAANLGPSPDHGRFLSLMAEDAREVNTLLNKLSEVVNYAHPAGVAGDGTVDVPAILRFVHGNLQYLAEDASIALSLAVPEAMPAARGNHALTLLVFFLALQHALSCTDPLGEIIMTAAEREGWAVEICFANRDIPASMAVYPEKHGLAPVVMEGWSDSAPLQVADSILGLYGGALTFLRSERGLGFLKIPLVAA
jgi:hypothetical protein